MLFVCQPEGTSRQRESDFVKASWWIYIIRCKDDSLYTGCTDNIPRRFDAHSQGRGAKYTRGRGPLTLVYTEVCADRSAAQRREAAVKRLTREKKLALIAKWEGEPPLHNPEKGAIIEGEREGSQ